MNSDEDLHLKYYLLTLFVLHHSLTCIIHLKLAFRMQMLTSNRRLKVDQLGLIINNRCFIWDLNAIVRTKRVNLLYPEFLGAIWGVFLREVYIGPQFFVQLWYIDAFRSIVQLNMPTNGIPNFMSTYLISKIVFFQLQMYTIIVYNYVYSSLIKEYI